MIKVARTNLEPVYHQVNSDEGRYDAHAGWALIATDTEGNHWLFAGKKADPAADYHPPVCFRNMTIVQAYAVRVQAEGINENHWYCFESPSLDDLPDYVTNWWRPEYN